MMKKAIVISILINLFICSVFSQRKIVINNLNPRTDINGEVVDVHDGCIMKFGKVFYWYGTVYGNTSGFGKTNYFQCYSSLDLTKWEKGDRLLVDPPEGVYYRPHVIYNSKTRNYVLWYNWYPNLWNGKFGVAISKHPEGPYQIVNDDVRLFNSNEGLGDFSIFVDDDGIAYIAYNTINGHKGSIEKLSSDYLTSTMENGGFFTEDCEAGSIFKRNGIYYFLTDYTCCFCTQGSGVRVYTSKNPMKGYKFKNNINRYPGTPAIALIDKNKEPNLFSTIRKQNNGEFNAIQIDFQNKIQFTSLKFFQFTGNRFTCCDTLTTNCREKIDQPEIELYVKENNNWIKVNATTSIESSSIYQVIKLSFNKLSPTSILLKIHPNYLHENMYVNEIEFYDGKILCEVSSKNAMSFINDIDPKIAMPIIPAQQTHIMPLQTMNGIEYIWMGDLWGSASDNKKGHDYQYWSAPLIFDQNGEIEPLKWVNEWETIIN
jgi:hypothetical protein